MASIKVKFRTPAAPDLEGSIYYQIIHERKVRQLHSTYRVFPYEWDEKRSTVKIDNSHREDFILSLRKSIRTDVERITKIIRRFEDKGMAYHAEDIIEEVRRYSREYTLFSFMNKLIANLRLNGRIRTAETYTATIHSFMNFLASKQLDNNLMLDSITSDLMEAYEAWHREKGNSLNTVSFYTRILRAVYNRAVDDDIIENRKPFRRVYTGIEKTPKRALPISVIKRIKTLDLTAAPALDFARDMFIISFMFRGMSFIDMAFLRKTDLADGHIIYRRRKTGQQLTIKWTKEMQTILDKYPENSSDYLLPIIRRNAKNERSVYRNTGYCINQNLKAIAAMIGISVPLTLYVARHSWASAAKAKGIPLNIISEGMGHDSETTTRIYLSGLDTSLIDHANSLIISSI